MKNKKLYLTIILTFIVTFSVVTYISGISLWMFVFGDNYTPLYNMAWIIGLTAGISIVWYIIHKSRQSKFSALECNIFLIISLIIISLFLFSTIKEEIERIAGSTPEEAVRNKVMKLFPGKPLEDLVITEISRFDLPRGRKGIEYEVRRIQDLRLIARISVSTHMVFWWQAGSHEIIDPDFVPVKHDCNDDSDCDYLDCTIYDTPVKEGYNAQCVNGLCDCICGHPDEGIYCE